jgi:hypothetical protein
LKGRNPTFNAAIRTHVSGFQTSNAWARWARYSAALMRCRRGWLCWWMGPGKQLRMIAAEEDTDVKSLLIEAINLLFKTRGKSQIARDPIER